MIRLSAYWLVVLIALIVLDSLWLPFVAGPMFRSSLGDLLLPKFRMIPAILFYAVYAAGLSGLVLANPRVDSTVMAFLLGGAFGLVAYATYDLTNMATLRPWTWKLVLVDAAWGSFATGLATAIGWWSINKVL